LPTGLPSLTLLYRRFISSWELPRPHRTTSKTLRARDWTAIRQVLPDRWPSPSIATLSPISRLVSATSWMATRSWYVGICF
jgi:hypothetical protein